MTYGTVVNICCNALDLKITAQAGEKATDFRVLTEETSDLRIVSFTTIQKLLEATGGSIDLVFLHGKKRKTEKRNSIEMSETETSKIPQPVSFLREDTTAYSTVYFPPKEMMPQKLFDIARIMEEGLHFVTSLKGQKDSKIKITLERDEVEVIKVALVVYETILLAIYGKQIKKKQPMSRELITPVIKKIIADNEQEKVN